MSYNIKGTFNIMSPRSIPVPRITSCLHACSAAPAARCRRPCCHSAAFIVLWHCSAWGCAAGRGRAGRYPQGWGKHPLLAALGDRPCSDAQHRGKSKVGLAPGGWHGHTRPPPTPDSPPLSPGTIRARRRGRGLARWRGQPWSPPGTPAASASRLRSAKRGSGAETQTRRPHAAPHAHSSRH